MSTTVSVALIILGVVFIWFVVSLIWGKPWSINLFYNRVFLDVMFDSPELLTMLGVLERVGIRGHNAKLSDASDAHEARLFRKARRNLNILRSYNRERQTAAQRMSTDILDWYMDDQLRGELYRHHNYPLNQMFGIQSELPDLMMNLHPLKTKRDARHYIKRLGRFGVKFDQVLEGLQIRAEKGIVPPNFTVRHVLAEMRDFTGQPAEENPLYTVFRQKLSDAGMSEAELQPLLAEVKTQLEHTVYPAYHRLIENFAGLEAAAQENQGVWALPEGDAYYAHSLRSNTTTDLTPEEIHAIGLEEVARIEARMSEILESLGHPAEDPTRQLLELGQDPRFLYPNTDEGREACLVDYARMLEEIDAVIEPVFDLRPKAGVEVKRVPEFKEKTSPGAYYQMSDFSGSRPGVFFANLRDMKETQKFGMKTLAYHEAIPGHHFQLAIAQGLKGMPFFRKLVPFTAYVEGWAMYAENLAHELGMYRDDPYGELGFLDSILFRAVRLVVDTGIHYKRWTREQAIEYMEAHTGQAHEVVVSEIERYFVMPGQACAYKIGELNILALRARAEEALGERFDLRAFHNLILGQGAMPLTLLEQNVETYLASAGRLN